MWGRSAVISHTLSLYAGLQWDYVFDWTVLKYQQQQHQRSLEPLPAAQPIASTSRDARRGTQEDGANNYRTSDTARRRCAPSWCL